jgi:hypothetical protein
MKKEPEYTITQPGMYLDGSNREIDATEPDFVICRRVKDFPVLPSDAKITRCTECNAKIAYNPASPHPNKPKVCMQCRDIEPITLQ